MNTGQKINKLRKEKKLTLDQLVRMTGLSKATLSRIENNVVGGNVATLRKIAGALCVSFDNLMVDENDVTQIEEESPKLLLAAVRKDLEVITGRLSRVCKRLKIEIKEEEV